jgi:flagellar hook-length control protein FliK
MQTTTLPIQVNGAGAAPQRPNAQASADASQFSAALSREIEQRHEQAAPSPVAAPRSQAQPKPAQAGKPASSDAKAPAQEPAKPSDASAGDKADTRTDSTAKPDDARQEGDEASASPASASPATAQLTDMLALVASLSQPLQTAVAAQAQVLAQGEAGAAAGAKAGHPAQLAALQAAKGLAKDGADAPLAKGLGARDEFNSAGAAVSGAALASDQKAGAKAAIEVRAVPDAFAAQLSAQRDAQAQAQALHETALAPAAALQVQAAALAAAQAGQTGQAAPAAAGERIAARVGTAAWDQQVGQKIVWMVAGEEQSASLTLNPPDLGPLQVVLNVSNDQASVAFSSNQLEVRQALENALPRLREMLGESGIALGNATVNAGMPDQRQAQDGEQQRSNSPSSRFDGGPAVAETATRPAARVTALSAPGMVDTFA